MVDNLDAVIPVGVASIAADGTITETSDKSAGDDMTGYAYSGNYYFAKTKTADNSRADYFVSGKTIASHSAVKLPAGDNVYAVESGTPNDGKWVPVGSDITVELFRPDLATSLGNWYTCNYGQSVPEALGTLYTFADANALEGVTLPTSDQFETINNSSNCSYTWLTVHGQQGAVIKAARGFLFLPAQFSDLGCYWSSTATSGSHGFVLLFYNNGEHQTHNRNMMSGETPVRPVYEE